MKDPLGFHNEGLVSRSQIGSDPLIPELPGVFDPKTLVDASAEYQLILPYVLMMVAPGLPSEPLADSKQFRGVPTSLKVWKLGRDIVQLGRRGRDLGINSQAVFGIPRVESEEVFNFVRSIVINDPANKAVWALRLQEVEFLDPLCSRSKPLEAADITVKAHAFALDEVIAGTPNMIYLQPCNKQSGVATDFRIEVKCGEGDLSLARFAKAVAQENDPLHQKLHFYDPSSFRDRHYRGTASDTSS